MKYDPYNMYHEGHEPTSWLKVVVFVIVFLLAMQGLFDVLNWIVEK